MVVKTVAVVVCTLNAVPGIRVISSCERNGDDIPHTVFLLVAKFPMRGERTRLTEDQNLKRTPRHVNDL